MKKPKKQPKAAIAAWENRIVGYGTEAPDQLLANPLNFRIHPGHQRDALVGVLQEVGWVTEVMVNKRTGMVVDGHLRVKAALSHHQPSVPVKYVDLSPAEEAEVLATYDTMSALAGTDPEILKALLAQVSTSQVGVQALLDELAQEHGLADLPKEAPEPKLDQAEALLKKWKVKTGQLWLIGKHRLLCGDATSQADVQRLLDGKRPVADCHVRPGGDTILDTKGRTVRHKPWWMMVGRGPDGKQCRDCLYLRRSSGSANTYLKCGQQVRTAGPGTDIRAKDEACRLFKELL